MLGWEARMDIKDLRAQGHSMRAVARLTGHARTTVHRALHPEQRTPPQKRGRKSRLEPHKDYLRDRYLTTGLSGVRLHEEVCAMGYTGAIDSVQRFLKELDTPRHALTKATVRFETPPGEQAQVDWAEVGYYTDDCGARRKVYAFVMILSFSRMLYVEFVTRMNVAELIACHQRAFAHFGGWTRRILYDNMKQVRLSATEWNPLMMDFLSHHGIAPATHRPYRPRTKGKVERAIRYLKDNFLKGREFADLADLRAQGQHWQEGVANVRVHATTHARPCDLLNNEDLLPLASVAVYRLSEKLERKVDAEGYVRVAGSRYSVPPTSVGQRVIVEQGEGRITVRLGEVIIAEHLRATRTGECHAHPEHVAAMWRLAYARTPVARTTPSVSGFLIHQPVAVHSLSVYEEVTR